METNFTLHALLVLWAFILGCFLCGVYDVFRVLRLRRKQNAIVLFFFDLLFCGIAAVALLLLFFNLSYGRVRAYALAFAFCGFLLWRFTVSRAVIALCLRFINFAERLLNSLKMRVGSLIRRTARRVYTVFYCRVAVKRIKRGFEKGSFK